MPLQPDDDRGTARPPRRGHGLSAAWVLYAPRALLVLLALMLVALAWMPSLNVSAADRVEAGLKRALASYAVARGLNAAISVLQGTQVAIQPAGLGVMTSPGEALDPLNDLIEQFSTVLLAASVAFGVALVLINVGGHWVVSALLTLAGVAWLLAFLTRRRSAPALGRFLLLLAFVRFAVPLSMLLSDVVHREFLNETYQAAQAQILHSEQVVRRTDGELSQAAASAKPPEGIAEKLKGWMPKLPDLQGLTQQVKDTAERAIGNVVSMMTIFLVETVIVPLFFMWAFWATARGAFRRGRRA